MDAGTDLGPLAHHYDRMTRGLDPPWGLNLETDDHLSRSWDLSLTRKQRYLRETALGLEAGLKRAGRPE